MRLGNEKIDVVVVKEGEGRLSENEHVIFVDNTSSARIAKKKLYRRIVAKFEKEGCHKLGICSGNKVFIFAFKYPKEYFHPDYYCDVAGRISKYVLKNSNHKEQAPLPSDVLKDKGIAVIQKCKNKIGSVDVDKFKRGADTGLTKLADRLNGLSDYYNYNGEANEIVNIQEEELELDLKPAYPESKQHDDVDAKVSEKPHEPEEKNLETLTYKNDKSSEDEKFKKFKNSDVVTETLYTAEFENFKKGIFTRI